jgi:hypothetical protein
MSRRRRGRPPLYAQKAVFDRICERIAEGESLASVCRDPSLPSQSTVYRWLKESDDAETLRVALQLADLEAEFGEFLREKYTRVRTHARP